MSESSAGEPPGESGGREPSAGREPPGAGSREPRSAKDSPEQFALNFDRRVASAALWLGGVALVVALLTVFAYATRVTLLGSPWAELREASGWLFLVYLPAAFCSVLLGLFTVWISRDFKRSGALAAALGGGSVLVILVGYAAGG
jgi:hypothetical protein